MKRISSAIGAVGLAVCAFGVGQSPTHVFRYNGKFLWVKLGALPPQTAKSLAKAKTLVVDITFPQQVRLKKDAKGYVWFTIIAADQGGDWKWNQTAGSALVPTAGNTIKAGTYHVSLPLAGIQKSVLGGAQQSVSIGANCSGLVGLAAFTINGVHGK